MPGPSQWGGRNRDGTGRQRSDEKADSKSMSRVGNYEAVPKVGLLRGLHSIVVISLTTKACLYGDYSGFE